MPRAHLQRPIRKPLPDFDRGNAELVAHEVAAKFRWGVASIEEHPGGAVIVVFDARPAGFEGDGGTIFEVRLDVVEAMYRKICRGDILGSFSDDLW
jgi:hypothetical protein